VLWPGLGMLYVERNSRDEAIGFDSSVNFGDDSTMVVDFYARERTKIHRLSLNILCTIKMKVDPE